MEPLVLPVRTAPVRLSSGTWFGQQAGGNVTGAGSGEAEWNLGANVEPYRFAFDASDPNAIEIPVYGGDPRIYPLGIPRQRVSLDLFGMPEASLRQLQRMIRSNRPIALGAWHDESTIWMSRFGGASLDGSPFSATAEVGICSEGTVRRSLLDYVPSPVAGHNVMRTIPNAIDGSQRPKIVAGMIGSAVSLSSARRNAATFRLPAVGQSVWSRLGATIGGLAERLTHNFLKQVPGESYSIPYNGEFNDGLDISGITITASTRYVATVLVRGHGTILMAAMNGSTNIATTTLVLSGSWQPISLAFLSQGGQTALRLRLYSTGGSGVAIQTSSLMLELGYGPTDFIDGTTTPSVSDAIWFQDPLPMGGWSACWWYKHRADSDIKMLFSVNLGSGSDVIHGFLFNNTVQVAFGSFAGSWTLSGPVHGAWSQIVLCYEGIKSSGSLGRFRLYFNGVDHGTRDGTMVSFYPSSSAVPKFYIGSDDGNPAPSHYGLHCELDRFRLDGRVWTATEVADEYRRFTDPGTRAILEAVEGRYFRASMSHAPQSVYTDIWDSRLDLVEVRVNRQAVY